MDRAERWAELSRQRVDHGGGLKLGELQPVGETESGLGDRTLESRGACTDAFDLYPEDGGAGSILGPGVVCWRGSFSFPEESSRC